MTAFLTKHHICVDGRNKFSTAAGDCVVCREAYAQFQAILAKHGGDKAFQRFVKAMRELKQAGKHGRSLSKRMTRDILNSIARSGNYSNLIAVYGEYLEGYGIGLVEDDAGHHHDYTGLKVTTIAHAPRLVLQWEKGGTVGRKTLATGRNATFKTWRLRIDALVKQGKAQGYHVTARIV